MGQLLEIGASAGKAAPGEYSPPALLTTAGQVLGRNASGVGQIYVPGYLLTNDLGRAYTGDGATTPETSILLGGTALSNLIPAAAAVGDSFDVNLRGTFLNNSGSGRTITINVYYGAYQMVSVTSASLTTSATARIWSVDLKAVIEVVGAGSSGKIRLVAQRIGFNAQMGAGTGWQPVSSAGAIEVNDGASSGTNANLVTNAAAAFNVTAIHSANANTITTTLNLARVAWYPKNY